MTQLAVNLDLAAQSVLNRRGDYIVEAENVLTDVSKFLVANPGIRDYDEVTDLVADAKDELDSDPLGVTWYLEELARILR